jgi:hypothetical protein
MKTLLQLNIFISQLETYYANSHVTYSFTRLEEIQQLKKKIANIAAYPAEQHPEKIMELVPDIKRVMPHKTNPARFIFSPQLCDILTMCNYYSKVKTA